MTGRQPKEHLLMILTQPLSDNGLDLEDVEVSNAGRRQLIRVLLDKDGGVTLDDIARATTVVSDLLDRHDALDDHPYTLEVTSPGVDRPLTEPRHWRRNIGRLVHVHPREGADFTGRIVEAGDESATVDVDAKRRDVLYAEVAKARVQIEFNRSRTAAVGSAGGTAEPDGKE